jgi:hypothetical protein
MIYHLFEYLQEAGIDFPGLGLMKYITFRALMATITALMIALYLGPRIIRKLQKKQIGEEIRDLGLEGQMQKKGTPTMGGTIILFSILIPAILFGNITNVYVILLIITTIWLGLIGFLEDSIKVFKKNKDGLKGKYKVVGQITLGILVGVTLCFSNQVTVREKAAQPTSGENVIVETAPDHSVAYFKEIKTTREGREWTLELLWDRETVSYTLTIDRADGAPSESITLESGEKFILPEEKRREDEVRYYDFVGWRDANGHLYNGGYELTVGGDYAFTAEFVPGEKKLYSVVFKTEVGTFDNGSAQVTLTGYYGDPLLPPTIEKHVFGEVVYSFLKWDKDVPSVFGENTSYTAVYTTPNPFYFLNYTSTASFI